MTCDFNPVESDGYDEHAAAVTSTAAVLTASGYGTPLSWQTEIAHEPPYGYTQYADLTMRAPDAAVPAMLLEVDALTSPSMNSWPSCAGTPSGSSSWRQRPTRLRPTGNRR
ncbi:hypothetical protein ACFVY4_34710 [Streptomyces sp. NPDC058299]|uniref:hypothetical protein n=1 Tax=Streptomyces sp. NPDC058299 TaxID=3346435 RepID=UPI0036E40D63